MASPPSFDAIDQSATRSGFHVFMDRPILNGARQKNWVVSLVNQRTPLLLSVVDGPSFDGKEQVTVCGIDALGTPGLDLQYALSPRAAPGEPVNKVDHLPGGGIAVYWTTPFGDAPRAGRAQVILSYDLPNLAGSHIHVIYNRLR